MLNWIWNKFFNNKSAAWTALFTGVLTVFTIKMWQVAATTSEATRTSQRAWMNLRGMSLGPDINNITNSSPAKEFIVTWGNTGATVAKQVVFEGNQKPELENLPNGYDFPLDPSVKTESVVSPQGGFDVRFQVPMSELEDNWKGRNKLFFWGDAIYKDVFPKDAVRLSEFCVEVTHMTTAFKTPPIVKKGEPQPYPTLGQPNVAIVGFSWQPCSGGIHMCYDEDCKDYADRIKGAQPSPPTP